MVKDSLIGREITFRQRLGPFFYLCIIVSVGLLAVAAATKEVHPAAAAAWPLAYAVVWIVRRRAPADIEVGADQLQFPATGFEIPFSDIQGLRLNDQIMPSSKATGVAGDLEILATGDVHFLGYSRQAGDLYEFLLQHVPATGSPQVSARLSQHLEEVQTTFDADLVHTFNSRRTISAKNSPILWAGLSGILAALVLALLALASKDTIGWSIGYGVWGVVLSLIGVADNSSRRHPPGMRKWLGSSIVLSPAGLAVHQNDLVGKMSWEQIRGIRCGTPMRSFAVANVQRCAMTVTIHGATFQLPDMYDRPLAIIYREMMEFWNPDENPKPAATVP